MARRNRVTIDVYAVLGVSPSATTVEIKTAYRRLAHEFHPDVSGNAEGEERFKQLSAAYDILKDPIRRADYDVATRSVIAPATPPAPVAPPPGPGWRRARHRTEPANSPPVDRPAPTPTAAGLDVQVKVELTYADAINGAKKSIDYRHRATCPVCKGLEIECRRCHGLRWIDAEATFTWDIPPGVVSGALHRVEGAGDRVGDGIGALILRVSLEKQPGITRVGTDFHLELRVPTIILQRGGRVPVDGPAGKLSVAVAQGTKIGTRLQIPDAGIPFPGGRGSVFVTVFEAR